MFAAAVILAHQGGWDEILLVAGPIVLIAGLLTLAKRRVDAAAEADHPDQIAVDQTSAADRRGDDQPSA